MTLIHNVFGKLTPFKAFLWIVLLGVFVAWVGCLFANSFEGELLVLAIVLPVGAVAMIVGGILEIVNMWKEAGK